MVFVSEQYLGGSGVPVLGGAGVVVAHSCWLQARVSFVAPSHSCPPNAAAGASGLLELT